ncbi:response regulator [Robiginitalea sp. SC105]|uniref:response regulator n=1 Tax=Robiginitalea sp. SC105 TaxID=2762332 RepID=UPI00163AB30F|nr:response regulator [Robiginitalea sp. SC105]MBC2839102.1 response regulator [Robiginitalea sp. SC105]
MNKVDTVFIIDDDPITVFGIRKMLMAMEAAEHTESFANGQLAFQKIQQLIETGGHLPEVIFLDINMPIMDGWQFLEAFTKLLCPRPIRINIVTSSIDPYDLQRFEGFKSRTRHLLEYRNKPIKMSDLQEMTRAA